jgi:hypothetical protein
MRSPDKPSPYIQCGVGLVTREACISPKAQRNRQPVFEDYRGGYRQRPKADQLVSQNV